MPRDISLSDSKCWNGGKKWVLYCWCTSRVGGGKAGTWTPIPSGRRVLSIGKTLLTEVGVFFLRFFFYNFFFRIVNSCEEKSGWDMDPHSFRAACPKHRQNPAN